MCCSAWPAIFSKTITGTWEVLVDGVVNHVIWYQNRVGAAQLQVSAQASAVFEVCTSSLMSNPQQTADQVFLLQTNDIAPNLAIVEANRRRQGATPRTLSAIMQPQGPSAGNCLIIPLQGSWESIHLLNTADTPSLLSDIERDLGRPMVAGSMEITGSWGAPAASSKRMVFLKFDIYDIVIAECASDIGKVIEQVDPAKRPQVNSEVFDAFEKWYQSPVAVCCFNSNEQGEAKPIAFAFQPSNPEKLSVYTLDAHDGKAPDPKAAVQLDHSVFVGSFLTPKEYTSRVNYSDVIPDHLAPYLLHNVMGTQLQDYMANGDIVFDVAKVRQGYFQGKRELPPFAPSIPNSAPRIIRLEAYQNGNMSLREPVVTF